MTKTKTTKRALIASVLSLLVCFTMLIGSTFAWFTDSASTGVNNIVAGTLDIALYTDEDCTVPAQTLTFKKAAGAENEKVLFEPGAKYELTQVWLKNDGNLHAKYKVVINGIDAENDKLAEVLDVYIDGTNMGTLKSLIANAGVIKEHHIAPDEKQSFGKIELMMQTSADNNYQGLTIDGIAITVLATQYTAENDSYNNTYDAGADYPELLYTKKLSDAVYGAEKGDDGKYIPVVIENKTVEGNVGVSLGDNDNNYGSDKLYDMTTTMNNVIVKDNAVDGWYYAQYDSYTSWHFGTIVFGTATLKNCTITGTTANPEFYAEGGVGYGTSAEDVKVADLAVFNYSKATINGGTYGSIVAWTHVDLDIVGAKVNTIYASCRKNFNENGLNIGEGSEIGLVKLNDGTQMADAAKNITLYVEDGAKVDTIDLTGLDLTASYSNVCVVDIADGATVGKIIVGQTTYTSVADFYEAYPTLKPAN